MVVFLALMVAAVVATWEIVDQTTTEPPRHGSIPNPQIVLLTDRLDVTVSYTIQYYAGSATGPAGTRFNPKADDLPTGVRNVQLTFQTAKPGQTIRYALLLNGDAVMTNATSVDRVGDIDVTTPGREVDSACTAIASFPTAQVISSTVTADQAGTARANLVGGIPETVRYERAGERTAVNVIQILPALGANPHGPTDQCNVNLVNWEQVGGIAWQSPKYGAGTIAVADVSAGAFVESSNPPIINARSLNWQLQGPASVTYTLFDTDVQSGHELALFVAGILAALAAALLVEVTKGIREMFEDGETQDEAGDAATGADYRTTNALPEQSSEASQTQPEREPRPQSSRILVRRNRNITPSRSLTETALLIGAAVLAAWVTTRIRFKRAQTRT
jgi:hypothetical protein